MNHRPRINSTASMGFTLIEMVVGCAMFAIIATALTSAVLLAGKAVPNASGPNAMFLSAANVATQFNAELATALSITEMTPTAITFTVGDRDGDGNPETIRYAWSGVADSALTRQYNSAPAVTVLDHVNEWALNYDRETVANASTYTDGAEALFASYTNTLLASAYDTKAANWIAQIFTVSLPSNAARWRVTRIRFYTRTHGPALGEIHVQLRSLSASNQPGTMVIDQAKVMESSLSTSFAWVEVAMPLQTPISASTTGASVVFRWVSDADPGDIAYQSLLGLLSGLTVARTTNSGSTWTSDALSAIPIYVYGIVSTKDPTTYSYYLTNVRSTLRAGTDSAARVCNNTRIATRPQVSGP